MDIYFSADVETDGPIPGPYSMLSFALVYAGKFYGHTFERPSCYDDSFYAELRPISDEFEAEALRINGLDRDKPQKTGLDPSEALTQAAKWIENQSGPYRPVLVAYPLSFDWSWLYWYFTKFSISGSPFNHSSCFDIKTAFAVKGQLPIARAGRSSLLPGLQSTRTHSHNALDDAIEQAEIFANLFEWQGIQGKTRQ